MHCFYRQRLQWPCEGIQHGKSPVQIKTIDTLKQERTDDGKFVYCLDRSVGRLEARYNPYDLVVATPTEIKSTARYFTVTATYVTVVSLLL